MGHPLANGALRVFLIIIDNSKTSVRDTGNMEVITQQESCQPFLYRPFASIVS